MEVKRTVCDVGGCNEENASLFTSFKERLADGAGSMENWYYNFDLCPQHVAMLTRALIDITEASAMPILFDKYKIKTRLG